jgi:hypothetical protein
MLKLNLGCGGDVMEGWENIDLVARPGVHVMDIDKEPMPEIWHNQAEEIYMSHILEHLRNPLFVMEELWKVAAPGCKLHIRVPYGSSDNAWEDPTHVRPYFLGSWLYFSQLYYVKIDYGYRGDWDIDEITLDVYADKCDSNEGESILQEVKMKRNMVDEMRATLIPVKPIRVPASINTPVTSKIKLNFV